MSPVLDDLDLQTRTGARDLAELSFERPAFDDEENLVTGVDKPLGENTRVLGEPMGQKRDPHAERSSAASR
ncbi:hypothetical protein JAAN108728_04650 [Janibacter anophelis]